MTDIRSVLLVLSALIAMNAHGAKRPAKTKSTAACGAVLDADSETVDAKDGFTAAAEELKARGEALEDLFRALPIAFPHQDITAKPWYQMLPRLLITATTHPSDLVTVALIGATGMGKSTLTNAIPGLAAGETTGAPTQLLSATGRLGGTTLRPLIVVPEGEGPLFQARWADLQERYKTPPMKRIGTANELLIREGGPLYTTVKTLESFPNVVIIDTPDMTTGDHRHEGEGANIATARNAMLAADVLLIMLHDNNLKDRNLGKLLAQNFKYYGARHSVFIIRTEAEPGEEMAEVNRELIAATRRIYELEPEENVQPTAVLAMYAMPADKLVRSGKAYPELITLNGSEPFPMLMHHLSENSAELRSYAATKAAEVIVSDLHDELKTAFKHRYAVDIYRMALRALANVSPVPINFPYDIDSDRWRDMLTTARPSFAKNVEKFAGLTAFPGIAAARMGKEYRDKKQPKSEDNKTGDSVPSLEDIVTSIEQSVNRSWVTRLTKITSDLQNERVELLHDDAEMLLAHMERFNSIFKDDQVPQEPLAGSKELSTIRLPSIKLLGRTAQSTLDEVGKLDEAARLRRLTKANDTNLSAAEIETRIAAGLNEIHEKYRPESKHRDFWMNIGTAIGGWGPAGLAGFIGKTAIVTTVGGIFSGGIAVVTGVGLAAYIHLKSEGKVDRDLKPMLDQWFREYQTKTFGQAFEQGFLQPIQSVLANDAPVDQSEALTTVQRSLRLLGASVSDYSHL